MEDEYLSNDGEDVGNNHQEAFKGKGGSAPSGTY